MEYLPLKIVFKYGEQSTDSLSDIFLN